MDLGDDLRSVHFLPFPTPRKEYYDPVVERQVARMQAVIVLVRAVRDKHTRPVKASLI
jgi:isoleucyl-tRNA synthetase